MGGGDKAVREPGLKGLKKETEKKRSDSTEYHILWIKPFPLFIHWQYTVTSIIMTNRWYNGGLLGWGRGRSERGRWGRDSGWRTGVNNINLMDHQWGFYWEASVLFHIYLSFFSIYLQFLFYHLSSSSFSHCSLSLHIMQSYISLIQFILAINWLPLKNRNCDNQHSNSLMVSSDSSRSEKS